MAAQNTRRKDGGHRVHWREDDLTLVIPKVVDLITGNPKLPLGKAFMQAQEEVLQPARRRAESLADVAENQYGKLVDKEIKRREKESTKSRIPMVLPSALKSNLRGPLVASPPPSPEPASAVESLMSMVGGPEQFRQQGESIAQGMGSLVARLIASVGDAYEQALYEELRSRGPKAVLRAATDEAAEMRASGMRGIPPAPPPLEHNSVKESTAAKPNVPQGKMKIGLVGNPAEDWRYFNRIKDGLTDKIEFIEIVKPRDTHRAAECHSIIFAGSTEQKLLNAVRAVAPHIHQVFNKRPDIINQMLSEQQRNWSVMQSGSMLVVN